MPNGCCKPLGEDLALRGRRAAPSRPEDAHPPRAAFGNENVAVRRDANDARHVEPVGEKIDREPGGAFGTSASVRASRLTMFAVERVAIGRRQVGRRDQAAHAWRVRPPVAERGWAGADRHVGKRRRRGEKAHENERSEPHSSHLGDNKPSRRTLVPASARSLPSNHIEFIVKAGAEMRG